MTDHVCPFCGSGSTSHVQLPTRDLFWVMCYRCKACGPEKATMKEAVAAWNIKTTGPWQKADG